MSTVLSLVLTVVKHGNKQNGMPQSHITRGQPTSLLQALSPSRLPPHLRHLQNESLRQPHPQSRLSNLPSDLSLLPLDGAALHGLRFWSTNDQARSSLVIVPYGPMPHLREQAER